MRSAAAIVWLTIALLASACSSADDAPAPGATDAVGLASLDVSTSAPGSQPAAISPTGSLQLVVFGMRHGTELPMVAEPGGARLGTIAAGSNNVYFTGDAQTSASGELLWKVEFGDLVGWVNPRFGYPASRDNITEQVVDSFGDSDPAQDNPIDTALVVSGPFSFTSPPTGIVVSQIIRSDKIGGHIVVDVSDEGAVGPPGLLGYRIEVVTALSADTNKYEIVEVWQTAMCQNGTADGACL